ncbi:LysR substrate-binding domain-containing protein [Sphaerisporangium sp. TRM90804]|uniref:LysR family transcriptional regulator n=1 Tax=Sphaerisporangium sp. TRM90804 TaxID=3031113 RepID=UPI0024485F9E|nr:LysR substrate-binding domain-containing protein [Sphaerisporangium sp. TRM90804]MDH2429696.1 LysR substrate-binding domain-containing protein [Sphaerisporangium sp. TRM90804]
METRELVYFLAVAEELHFGRAAERLGITQPPLSRTILRLERRLGVPLLERGGRGTVLTAAGEVLAREGVKALASMEAAERRARRAGRAEPRLVVAVKPGGDGGLLPAILTAYRDEAAAIEVKVLVCGVAERAARLRDGTADVTFLHDPLEDLTEFDSEPLLRERGVVALPPGHRLAERTSVTMADLRDEPLARWRGLRGPHTCGPEVRDGAELMQLVALGIAVAVVPESAAAVMRGDLVCVPVTDAAPTTVVLAWPRDTRSPALAAFVHTATRVATAAHRSS